MSKRFGRNQKRMLVEKLRQKKAELIDLDVKYINLWQQIAATQQKDYELHDVGLRVQTYRQREHNELVMRASIGEYNYNHAISVREIQYRGTQQDFINHVAHHLAHDLVKAIGDKIRYE